MTQTAKRLVPIVKALPLCSASIRSQEAINFRQRNDPNASTACGNAAKWEIEGNAYCARHAGEVALQILSREKP